MNYFILYEQLLMSLKLLRTKFYVLGENLED